MIAPLPHETSPANPADNFSQQALFLLLGYLEDQNALPDKYFPFDNLYGDGIPSFLDRKTPSIPRIFLLSLNPSFSPKNQHPPSAEEGVPDNIVLTQHLLKYNKGCPVFASSDEPVRATEHS